MHVILMAIAIVISFYFLLVTIKEMLSLEKYRILDFSIRTQTYFRTIGIRYQVRYKHYDISSHPVYHILLYNYGRIIYNLSNKYNYIHCYLIKTL